MRGSVIVLKLQKDFSDFYFGLYSFISLLIINCLFNIRKRVYWRVLKKITFYAYQPCVWVCYERSVHCSDWSFCPDGTFSMRFISFLNSNVEFDIFHPRTISQLIRTVLVKGSRTSILVRSIASVETISVL